ncbi:hypothetical protein [Corynebacterium hindlerae]|uniref:hypothetical protein n=1 Tax=Corynebacterium hindlerae TaxID=699041 RepID=UPI003AAD4009
MKLISLPSRPASLPRDFPQLPAGTHTSAALGAAAERWSDNSSSLAAALHDSHRRLVATINQLRSADRRFSEQVNAAY